MVTDEQYHEQCRLQQGGTYYQPSASLRPSYHLVRSSMSAPTSAIFESFEALAVFATLLTSRSRAMDFTRPFNMREPIATRARYFESATWVSSSAISRAAESICA
ncbi:Os07g0123601 [Oryza sativa Japonica Group]|uniref:Os07g0123601 protein n=1 Tax=Oryza sativa subsp. japonica TaxID=39947 RepID=A0A0P0X237_ORYSJ|nr:hypothetical protein EE612_036895 [Oryza sativa]BAS99878.1 Os07g0123601 [Oryza sativa Japonica Group]